MARAYYQDEYYMGLYPSGALHLNGVHGKVSGNLGALAEIEGCIPVLHGPVGCGFHYRYISRRRYLPVYGLECTQMTEEDVIFGGEEKLRQTIQRVIDTKKPKLIAIVPTTCSDMIHCEIDSVAEAFSDSTVKVIAVHSDCFSHINKNVSVKNTQKRVESYGKKGNKPEFEHKGCGFVEAMQALVTQVMEPQEKEEASVNIESFAWGYEGLLNLHKIIETLEAAGIKVHALLPGTDLEKIKTAPKAQLNIVRRLKWAKTMKEKFGTDYIHIYTHSDYLGIDGIRRFYMEIAGRLGREAKMESVLEEKYAAVGEKIKCLREKLGKGRYGIYSRAYTELPELIPLYEKDFGMPLRCIVIEKDDQCLKDDSISDGLKQKMLDNIRSAMKKSGCTAELIVNPDIETKSRLSERADCFINGRELMKYDKNLRAITGGHQFYPKDFESFAQVLESLASKVEAAVPAPSLLLNRIEFDNVYRQAVKDKNVLASHGGWVQLWKLRGKCE